MLCILLEPIYIASGIRDNHPFKANLNLFNVSMLESCPYSLRVNLLPFIIRSFIITSALLSLIYSLNVILEYCMIRHAVSCPR